MNFQKFRNCPQFSFFLIFLVKKTFSKEINFHINIESNQKSICYKTEI